MAVKQRVSQPARAISPARVGRASSRKRVSPWALCTEGSVPVNSEACAGRVQLDVEMARVYSTDSPASASRLGLVSRP